MFFLLELLKCRTKLIVLINSFLALHKPECGDIGDFPKQSSLHRTFDGLISHLDNMLEARSNAVEQKNTTEVSLLLGLPLLSACHG